MADRVIKTTLSLDGEQKYSDGLKAINKQLSVVASEMGAVTSSFDKNSATVADLSAKGQVLADKMDLQKQKQEVLNAAVKDAQEALGAAQTKAADLAAEYGENSTQAQAAAKAVTAAEKTLADYQIQSNNCTKTLNNMSKQQDENNKALDELKKKDPSTLDNKLKAMGKTLGTVAKQAGTVALEVGKIGAKGIDVAAKAFTGYATALTAAATAAFGLASNSAAAADEINTMAKTTGISTEQLQVMAMYSEQVDVSLETQAKSMAKLTKTMGVAASDTTAAAKAMAKFEALGIAITDSTGELRDNEDVFADAIEALGQIENETERDAVAMDLFGKSAQDLNPLIMGGADALRAMGDAAKENGLVMSQEALDGLNAFNDSLDNLKTNAAASGNIVAGAFAPSFQILTDLIGESIPDMANALASIFNGDDITAGQADLTAAITEMGDGLLTNIGELIPKFIAGFNAVILGVVNAITQSLPAGIQTVLPALLDGFNGLVGGIIDVVPELLPTLVDGGIMLFLGLIDSLQQASDKLMPMLPQLIKDVCDSLTQNLPEFINGALQLFMGLVTGLGEAIPQLQQSIIQMMPAVVNTLLDNIPLLIEAAIQLFVSLIQGIPPAIPLIVKAIPQVIEKIIEVLFETDWIDIGVQLIMGIGQGLIEGVGTIGNMIAEAGNALVGEVKEFFGIHSPSTLFADTIGLNLADGIGVGFEDEIDKVTKNMTKAIDTNINANVKFNNEAQGAVKGTTVNFYQTNNSPKALSRSDIYQQTRQQTQLAGALL